MSFKKINLEKYYNNKLIYDGMPDVDSDFGVDNICVLSESIFQAEKKNKEKIDYVPFDYQFGEKNELLCDNQEIELGMSVNKLHIMGFSSCGDLTENIKITYSDQSVEWKIIGYIDWGHAFAKRSFWANINVEDGSVKNILAIPAVGMYSGTLYFHDSICTFFHNKKIDKIVLPNNILTHILAITIEY